MYKLLFLAALIAVSYGITSQDFYRFVPGDDKQVPAGDYTSSSEISLVVPAKYYDQEFDYVWIHTDGFITFVPANPDSELEFPYETALLAPYWADLDTTNGGAVYYDELFDEDTLKRATYDVRRAYPISASNFLAESAFVVTWHNVTATTLANEKATFTFQSVLVSNGQDTYAIFLYPEGEMGKIEGVKSTKPRQFNARVGFNADVDKYKEIYPADDVTRYRNMEKNGQWIFQIGGNNVGKTKDVIEPENVPHQKSILKREAVFNVQEVNLVEEEGNDDYDDENDFSRVPQSFDYCGREEDACNADHAKCISHDNGYCCICERGFYGNGKICLPDDEVIAVNGNVTGTIDVRNDDGSQERLTINNVDYHSYVITSQGRAYTAISGVSPELGRALQPFSPVGEIIGWLFAIPQSPAVNGFQYTGGTFQRRLTIRIKDSDYRFDMRQRFIGVEEKEEGNVLVAHTNFVGSLPAISDGAVVLMNTYSETYTRDAPGRISSRSTRTYTVDGVEYQYDVNQMIIYSECSPSLKHVPDELTLNVSGIFLKYHDDDDNVRFAMNTKVSPKDNNNLPEYNPCDTGFHDCDYNAECSAEDGNEYSCNCKQGYRGDGYVCEDVDECVNSPCAYNAVCENMPGSFRCFCDNGYVMNDAGDECIQGDDAPEDPCYNNFVCGVGTCVSIEDNYRCLCPYGYYPSSRGCHDVDECSEDSHDCSDLAECVNTDGGYECKCKQGYTGDGFNCYVAGEGQDVDECANGRNQPNGHRCDVNAECHNTFGSYQCVCNERYEGDGFFCEPKPDEQGDNPCNYNPCGQNARCFPTESDYGDYDDYRCECMDGFVGDGYTDCESNPCDSNNPCGDNAQCSVGDYWDAECTCNDGWEGDGFSCHRVGEQQDECQQQGMNCHNDAQCSEDAYGRYKCQCNDGFVGNGEDCREFDESMDECQQQGMFCDEKAHCMTYRDGRFGCRCNRGFTGTGYECEDIDECALGRNHCDDNAECINLDGSYECKCKQGWRGDGYRCQESQPGDEDVDECAEGTDRCDRNADCFNTDGSYDCQCRDGWNGDGFSCQQEDSRGDDNDYTYPCDNPDVNNCQFECINVNQNDYYCVCPDGYNVEEDGSCSDINECRDNFNECDRNADCINIIGGYECQCRNGYRGNGFRCRSTSSRPRPTASRPTETPEMTVCQRKYKEVEDFITNNPEVMDGPEHPDCQEDGSFNPKQCLSFTGACWCVNPDTGVMVEGTLRMPEENFNSPIDCEALDEPPRDYTLCQKDRWVAEKEGFDGQWIPQCTESGAFEPMQQHPGGYFTCVDFNGQEISRHAEQPECLSKCKLQAYYAETDNVFLEFENNLVPKCEENGDYSPIQCDDGTCFCVNSDGEEIENTRHAERSGNDNSICSRGSARPHAPSGNAPNSLVFTQGIGLHQVDLPLVVNQSQAVQLWKRQGHAFVGVAFDCNSQNVYWTDVSGRSIYKSPINNMDEKHYVIRTGLRSPEGMAIDHTSGNIYWTDSGTDKIEVSAADGSKRMTLIAEGLKNPRGIALDVFQGKLYWSDWNRDKPRIMKADMDGNNVQVFLDDGLKLPNDIAFNAYNDQLCFVDSGTKKLECLDTNGQNRHVVHDLSTSNQPKVPFGLEAYGNMFYYTDRRSGRLHAFNSETNEDVSITGPIGVYGHMFGVALVNNQCPRNDYNACSTNNGGCSDSELCLPTSTGNTCKCPPDATDCSSGNDSNASDGA